MPRHSRWVACHPILITCLFVAFACHAPQARRPNVVMIITDDQGYGDLACHGNPILKTPNIDRLAAQCVELTRFYAMPVCSPTRACLMTGRYNYRTGVVDTYLGRSMMHGDEVTLAEILSDNGYRTGLFGKWHLGDCYPMRPQEQGFGEVLMHRGGGMVQPGDPPGSSYLNPILQHNGKQERATGYCTDVFTDAAIHFIEENRDRPFLCWLATNAPHTPLQVPDDWVKPYRGRGLDDATARVYAMCENIDRNVGRVMETLAKLGLEDDTILVFMTDNGPQQKRFNAGLRGLKGSVYEGGVRVPFFVRWPGRFKGGAKSDRIAAHVDFLPTIAELCALDVPRRPAWDGVSLARLLRGERDPSPERTVYLQWHRGDEPVAFRNAAAVTQRWKLVDGKVLYDLSSDPAEQRDVASQYPDVVASLRKGYEAWFADVTRERRFLPPRIVLGSDRENPVTLTRQDWRGPQADWKPASVGYWEVQVEGPARYDLTVRFGRLKTPGEVHLKLGETSLARTVGAGGEQCVFPDVALAPGAGRLEADVSVDGKPYGAGYVDVLRR
jgi:arylsulfatase A-like enzyme